MEELIAKVVKEIHDDFAVNPFKYTSSEAEAQYRLFALLESKYISGNVIITRSGPDGPIPPFEKEVSPRLRIEWGFGSDRRKKNDIVILKEGIENPSSYDDAEAVIEIKSTWGEFKHLDNINFLKDFSFVHKYPEIGYFLIFMGNKLNELKPSYQDYYIKRFASLKESEDYSFLSGHVYLIFRDEIIY